jgi:L-lysine 2,3-aminomutase
METTETLLKTDATNGASAISTNGVAKEKFTKADLHELMDRHGFDDDAKSIVEKENLLPTTLLSRLHNSYPHHSILRARGKAMFAKAKKKYSGLSGFKQVCAILEENGIFLTDMKERELFLEVYAFLATKHILSTIDWDNYLTDQVFQLVFPQPGMIEQHIVDEYKSIEDPDERTKMVVSYRDKTNPHDGKQMLNRPSFYSETGDFEALDGGQHKYPQVFLLFDKTTQSCFAYCTYCFRHAQVRGDDDMFVQDDVAQVHAYLRKHKEVTDILITGGDAGYMPANRLEEYLLPIIEDPELMHIRNIRIASRALTYQPDVVLTSKYNGALELFKKLIDNGVQVLWMGHFSTPKELLNIHTMGAIRRLRSYGVNVRSQSPMMNHISLFMDDNGKVDVDKSAQNWIDLGHVLMMLGMQFHSIYCARPTGEHGYFTAPLADMNKIFSKVYRSLPSVGRPSRYITMTSSAGKTSLMGVVEVNGRKAFALKFNEARNMKWLDKVYLAEYDETENTIEKLKPFDGGEYFYKEELAQIEKDLEKNIEN